MKMPVGLMALRSLTDGGKGSISTNNCLAG